MRGRFGRRRNRNGDGRGRPPLDAARELAQVVERGWVALEALAPIEAPEVPPELAAVGMGRDAAGASVLVAVSPERGGDAWIAALAVASRLAPEEGFAGAVLAISPRWSAPDRARLALASAGAVRIHALQPPSEGRGAAELVPEPPAPSPALGLRALVAGTSGATALLLVRAARALEGLAAKHGGDVRVAAAGVEMVLLARPVARLAADGDALSLMVHVPRRSTLPVSEEQLADSLDRLEGFLRKYLTERKNREGEGALRAAAVPALARAAEAAWVRRWPLVGSDPDPIDAVGAGAGGRGFVAAARRRLDLAELGTVLDGWVAARAALPLVAAPEQARLTPAAPRLVLAAEEIAPAAEAVLGTLQVEVALFGLEGAGREVRLQPRRLGARLPVAAPARAPEPVPAAPPREAAPRPTEPAPEAGGFEEVSIFELGEEGEGDGDGRRRRRRRGRGRGRGRRGAAREGDEGAVATGEADEAPEAALPAAAEGIGGEPAEALAEPGESVIEEALSASAPELEGEFALAEEEPLPEPPRRRDYLIDEDELVLGDLAREAGHDLGPPSGDAAERIADLDGLFDDESGWEVESEDDDGLAEDAAARAREEREARRRARLAKTQPEPEPAEDTSRRPRRRAAIVVHDDRDSVGAAAVLARDLRLIEGIWVYPQVDLMTFFRANATDLRDDTPIYLIGFTASPARETLQAASLYRGRITWIDHHEWPPEDLEGLRAAIGADAVLVEPGLGSSLPIVLQLATRRSRFTDKLVDLLTGRFSEHDFTRWGRLWWHRLGEIASRRGDQKAPLEPLLQGRPSDLAREAARVPAPPVPAEAQHVAERDFRLVHFGGLSMVLVPVPPELDVALTARIARARYGAPLSLAWHEGDERLVLAADDASGRRSLDVGGMVGHLDQKFEWVRALSDEDHVARFRIVALAEHPERLDAVVGEIAMGRSILEG